MLKMKTEFFCKTKNSKNRTHVFSTSGGREDTGFYDILGPVGGA